METPVVPLPSILKLIAHEIRWAVVRELARSDYRVQELVKHLGLPQNLISYHLRKLREGHVVSERRSSADEREVYYRLDLDHFHGEYLTAGSLIHPAVTSGGPDFLVLSAGTEPRTIHPLTIKAMWEIGIDISDHTAKGIEAFATEPPMDLVVTVCHEAQETCPFFPNTRRQVHWGFPDPSRVTGTEQERLAAFRHIRDLIAAKIDQFLDRKPWLSFEQLYTAAKAEEQQA